MSKPIFVSDENHKIVGEICNRSLDTKGEFVNKLIENSKEYSDYMKEVRRQKEIVEENERLKQELEKLKNDN